MRKIAAVSLFVAAGSVVAVSGAQVAPVKPIKPLPPPGAPTVAPQINLPPQIVAIRRTGPTAYTAGAVTYEADVTNPSPRALATNLLVDRLVPTDGDPRAERITQVPVRVAANGRATVTFTDASGLADGCNPNFHRLSLESGSSTKNAKTTPKCLFGAKRVDPMAGLAPDHRLRQQEGRLTYHSPRFVSRQVSCNIGPLFSVTTKNNGAATATGVHLRVLGPNGETSPHAAPTFDLAPGTERPHEAVGPDFKGQPGRWWLQIGGNGVPVFQPRFGVDVSRLCSLQVELTTEVPRLSRPAAQRGE